MCFPANILTDPNAPSLLSPTPLGPAGLGLIQLSGSEAKTLFDVGAPLLMLLILLMPLGSFVLLTLFGKRRLGPAESASVGRAVMSFSFILSLLLMGLWWISVQSGAIELEESFVWSLPWLPIGQGQWLQLGLLLDGLTLAMLSMVCLVSALVHVYSTGYMHGDKRYERFFAYLGLFSFAMLGIVISPNLLQMLIFWELVGLSSYLLIGFWYEKPAAKRACLKAFVMNRIGDAGMIAGIGILFHQLGGSLTLPAAEAATQAGPTMLQALGENLAETGRSMADPPIWLTLAGIGLFMGAMGKSAQFPLHTWLPDAMEGPTPVSSIVHSATMVAAGVYLVGRIYPILTPGAHLFIVLIGLLTLLVGALMAVVMTDIKRVLAYSTISQLGYMILAMGVGAWVFALLHLVFHAFFKCGLFQCAGSIIHVAHHQQDMRSYGGLRRRMPITHACFLICGLALAGAVVPWLTIGGVPLGLAGAYSKEGILAGVYNYAHRLEGLGWLAEAVWIVPIVVAYLTAFYTARAYAMTFWGKPRDELIYYHAHEVERSMWGPQVALAALAIGAAALPIGWFIRLPQAAMEQMMPALVGATPWLQPTHQLEMGHGHHAVVGGLLWGFGWLAAAGLGLALYATGFMLRVKLWAPLGWVHHWLRNRLYLDTLYDQLVVGITRLLALIAWFIDRSGFDVLVNYAGWLTRGTANAVDVLDRRGVDGGVVGAGHLARWGGARLSQTQNGRLLYYFAAVFITALIAGLVLLMSPPMFERWQSYLNLWLTPWAY